MAIFFLAAALAAPVAAAPEPPVLTPPVITLPARARGLSEPLSGPALAKARALRDDIARQQAEHGKAMLAAERHFRALAKADPIDWRALKDAARDYDELRATRGGGNLSWVELAETLSPADAKSLLSALPSLSGQVNALMPIHTPRAQPSAEDEARAATRRAAFLKVSEAISSHMAQRRPMTAEMFDAMKQLRRLLQDHPDDTPALQAALRRFARAKAAVAADDDALMEKILLSMSAEERAAIGGSVLALGTMGGAPPPHADPTGD